MELDIRKLLLVFSVYLLAVSFYSAAITCMDKRLAAAGGRRVPEKRLFAAALLGGAAAMYATMRLVRHKTLHKRFMIGLPLIMSVQAAAVIFFGAAVLKADLSFLMFG